MDTLAPPSAVVPNVRPEIPPIVEPPPPISHPLQSIQLEMMLNREVQAEIDKREQEELERLGRLAKYD